MADIVKRISYAMSLRTPQTEALSYLDAISANCDYKKDSKAEIEAVASAHCEGQREIKIADQFDFPSFCYSMATGIGKTRLMGACIYYLYRTKGYRHFFVWTMICCVATIGVCAFLKIDPAFGRKERKQ